MSEYTEDIPATLSEGEALIPEVNKEVVEEYIEKAKTVEAEEPAEEVITLAKPEKTGNGMAMVGDGTIGSTKVKNPEPRPKVEKKAKAKETVAVYSSKNVTWQEVGKVYIGYNIVTPEQAEKWLTRNHTRLATPEEVAKEFGL